MCVHKMRLHSLQQRKLVRTRQPALIFPTSWPNASHMRTLHPMRCFAGPHGLVYFLRHASRLTKTPHWGGGLRTQVGAISDPQFKLGPDFCTMHLPLSFIILCLLVRKFYRDDKQTNKHTNRQTHKPTNKQIPAKTSNVLRYATMLDNQCFVH